jgi:hypothetical protein
MSRVLNYIGIGLFSVFGPRGGSVTEEGSGIELEGGTDDLLLESGDRILLE